MKEDEFRVLVDRLKKSRLSRDLRSELIGVLRLQRHVIHEAWLGSRSGSQRSVELLTSIALGKSDFSPGDVGF